MDRYNNLVLECDERGGSVSDKAPLFGIFKKTSKSAEPSAKAQDKSGELGGQKSPRPGAHVRRPSQDLLDLSSSNDSLNDKTSTSKESGGMLGGIFKKSSKHKVCEPSQEDLLAQSELSGSTNSLPNTKESGGMLGGIRKKVSKPFGAKAKSQEDLLAANEISGSSNDLSKGQTKDSLSVDDEVSASNDSLSEKPSKTGVAAKILKNPFISSSQDTEKTENSGDSGSNGSAGHEPAAEQKDTENTKKPKDEGKQEQVTSNVIQSRRSERSETPPVPPKLANEEMKAASTNDTVKPRRTKEKGQSDDESAKEAESAERPASDQNHPENKTTHLQKLKHPNPFMPRVTVESQQATSAKGRKDEDVASKEENKEEGNDDAKESKVKNKPKRHNPFMPQVKAKVIQRNAQDGAARSNAENKGATRSLFDQLEDFRTDTPQPEDSRSFQDLMDWWKNVEAWEDTPQDDDMTEKEEAKAFAVTAEKVQKGIRVFNKLFSERAESLWKHVIDLNSIADGLDKFNKNTKIAQITGGSTSAIGGVATIAGLALAPVTLGTSLIVTAVGLGVATAGGLTSAGAGISNQVNNSMDRKKVEKIVEDYQEKMMDLNKCLTFIKQGIENLRKFDLIKMKKNAYNQDFPALTSSFYEDGAMAGKAILINANEIMRVVQIANMAGSTAARAVQIASMATGVLTGLFVGMDIYFVAKDSKELKKGAKSEFAAKIREVATQLHDGLVELNGIREELQSTTPPNKRAEDTKALGDVKTEKSEKHDSSDEIDRIKKGIKKDIENRDYDAQNCKKS